MLVLVINCGSSSIKHQLVDLNGDAQRAGVIERVTSHAEALDGLMKELAGVKIDAVGHRVVHGGEELTDAVRIDDAVIAAIERCAPLAPLHNPHNLAGIHAAMKVLPSVPHVGVFDTAFHSTMPRRARTYAIDREVAQRHGVRRYGFHGSSHAWVSRLAARHLGRPLEELRLVSCHLGNGASACAIEHGHSVDTSMGLTPLEGLVMGTRAGDIDPGVVLDLAEKTSIAETRELLNKKSGLAGLSGAGNDLRDIEARAAAGDDNARLAINVFAHRARKYIGAYAAVMGGLDAVIMTGGIGENSAAMRRRILQRMEFLGLFLDEDRNDAARVSQADPVADISGPPSRARALVIATNEERRIAEEVARVVKGLTSVAAGGPIPIAVSARHVHLDEATFAKLFGADAKITKHKDLSQPGEFASEQKLSVIGPRGRIDGVRLLGPLRGVNQVEVSRTDEFLLGVDAPIRRSGHVAGSAPVTLEGPKGRVTLTEGLVCAWRHIHMSPADAQRFGVEDGDEVEVAITGGPRDLVFGDVLVRVKDNFRLEMHIDTDEANAAELPSRSEGELVYTHVQAGAELRRRRGKAREG